MSRLFTGVDDRPYGRYSNNVMVMDDEGSVRYGTRSSHSIQFAYNNQAIIRQPGGCARSVGIRLGYL
jgi:hypothetical protein